jgi:hypothetical protein
MSETPQERIQRWLEWADTVRPPVAAPEVREAIRAVLAEVAHQRRMTEADRQTILRLEAERDALRDKYNVDVAFWKAHAEGKDEACTALRAEVERLTRDREAGEGHWIGKLKAAEAERAALLAKLAEAGIALADCGTALIASEAEVERLRESASRHICEGHTGCVDLLAIEATRAEKAEAALRDLDYDERGDVTGWPNQLRVMEILRDTAPRKTE